MPERRPKPETCAVRKTAASRQKRLRILSADMPPAAGVRPGIRRVQASCALPADCAQALLLSGEPERQTRRFDAVAQRPRGREAFPQAEHGSKTGKEQQKGLPSPGQSRKRKALFMFMRKR